jgi:hypothetical protein
MSDRLGDPLSDPIAPLPAQGGFDRETLLAECLWMVREDLAHTVKEIDKDLNYTPSPTQEGGIESFAAGETPAQAPGQFTQSSAPADDLSVLPSSSGSVLRKADTGGAISPSPDRGGDDDIAGLVEELRKWSGHTSVETWTGDLLHEAAAAIERISAERDALEKASTAFEFSASLYRAERDKAQARIEALELALAPFAKAADLNDMDDVSLRDATIEVCYGDCMDARAALRSDTP